MIVRFWDGSKAKATDIKDAIRIAEAGLEAWRQEGDKVVWIQSPYTGRLPAQAVVITEYCEETDAWATVMEVPDDMHGEDKRRAR